MDKVIDQLKAKLEYLEREKQNWNNLWQTVSDYVMPILGNFTNKRTQGMEINKKIFDDTPTIAAEMLAASLHGSLTNPSVEWFNLTVKDNVGQGEATYLEDVKDAVATAINAPEAGFATNIHEVYRDLTVLGTGCLYLTWNEEEEALRFQAIPLEQICIDEDAVGNISEVHRKFHWTIDKIEEIFGVEAIPESIRLKNDNNDKYTIVHTVRRKKINDEKPFESIYWMPEEGVILSTSSYYEMPYFVPRWSKASTEMYGRSPAINSLADIRMLQELMKETIISVQLSNRPPLLVPNDDTHNPIDIYPNALIRYRNGQAPQALQLGNRPDTAFSFMQDLRDRIRHAFYVDALSFEASPQKTATEIIQRVSERNKLMLPIMARLQTDLLEPMVIRAYKLLERHGMLPEIPQNITQIDVEYTGTLAMAQKTSQLERYLSLIQYAAPFIQLNPNDARMIDTEAVIRDISDGLGVKFAVKDHNVIEEADMAQAQQAQEQQNLQNQMTMEDIKGKQIQNQQAQMQMANNGM